MLRAADGHGAYWTDTIALADDHEPADGAAVLTFWQAQDKARVLVRGECRRRSPGHRGGRARRLRARPGDARRRGQQCARRPQADPRRRCSPARSGLLTFQRAAALARRPARRPQGVVGQSHLQGAQGRAQSGRRPRPAHRQRRGVAQRPGGPARRAHGPSCRAARARRAQARRAPPMRSARGSGSGPRSPRRPARGRPDRPARRRATAGRPRRPAPDDAARSKKGGRKRIERRPVPIPPGLAAKLRAAAASRPPGAPLLTEAGGRRAGRQRPRSGRSREAAARAGLAGVTAYALRHSSIIRALLAGVPVRVVAAGHDTSVAMHRDATTAPTFSITPTPSAAPRCSIWRCSREPRRASSALPVESPDWIPYHALKYAIDRFRSTSLTIAKLDRPPLKQGLSAATSKHIKAPV